MVGIGHSTNGLESARKRHMGFLICIERNERDWRVVSRRDLWVAVAGGRSLPVVQDHLPKKE